MDYIKTITDLTTKIRKMYRITPEILRKLTATDDFFPPLFTPDELDTTDIHKSNDPPRIIAFGDIHGDLQALVGILYSAELIGDDGQWKEERSTYVVQTGDLFDNYRSGVDKSCLKQKENIFDEFVILNFLTHLHKQAQKMPTKSHIVLCIGNHELMNVDGDMRYVHPDMYKTFGETERITLFENGSIFTKKMSVIFRVIVKIGDYLFMHGGIHSGNMARLTDIVMYNNGLYGWLYNKLDSVNPLHNNIYSTDGYDSSITWYRGLLDNDETEYVKYLDQLDTQHKLKVIVGHTNTGYPNTTLPQIYKRYNDRVILLDTAMSRAFRNDNDKLCDLSNYYIDYIVIDDGIVTTIRCDDTFIRNFIIKTQFKKPIPAPEDMKSLDYNVTKIINIIKKIKYTLRIFYSNDIILLVTVNQTDVENKIHKIYLYDTQTSKLIINGKNIEFKNVYRNVTETTNLTFHFDDNQLALFRNGIHLTNITQQLGGRIRSKRQMKRNINRNGSKRANYRK